MGSHCHQGRGAICKGTRHGGCQQWLAPLHGTCRVLKPRRVESSYPLMTRYESYNILKTQWSCLWTKKHTKRKFTTWRRNQVVRTEPSRAREVTRERREHRDLDFSAASLIRSATHSGNTHATRGSREDACSFPSPCFLSFLKLDESVAVSRAVRRVVGSL